MAHEIKKQKADPAILLFLILQIQVLFIGYQENYYLNNKRNINLIDMKKEKRVWELFVLLDFYLFGLFHY